ncbi:hypothetical protein [Actinoallomurus acaciae]|uniref:Uncharacterized protein n=1 Tax=Actinoallomurus acaciae TaxID=502577 RepID=A0ABV5YDL8_9ACTN
MTGVAGLDSFGSVVALPVMAAVLVPGTAIPTWPSGRAADDPAGVPSFQAPSR